MNTCAHAPGKLILSGEHAVVYGSPALVVAIARYTRVCFHPIHRSRSLRTALKGLTTGRRFPLETLHHLRHKLDQRFERFANGELPVKNILQRPDDLMLYTLAQLAGHMPVPGRTQSHGLPMPGHLSTESDLPLGAGMGSSAAIIAATLALYEYLLDKPQTLDERFEQIRFCERLQHGKGSAIDAAAVTYGGLQLLRDQRPNPVAGELSQWYWILTGIPQSSTGECVAAVGDQYGNDDRLWAEFSTCTQALVEALKTRNDPRAILCENHRLLQHIGVVPEKTAKLITAIEACGGAAKISGAGSIRGENGGVIIAWHPDQEALAALLQAQTDTLEWGEIQAAERGAERLIDPAQIAHSRPE